MGLLSTCSLHWLQSRASHLSVRLPGFHLEDPPPSLWCTPSLSQPLTPPPLSLCRPPPLPLARSLPSVPLLPVRTWKNRFRPRSASNPPSPFPGHPNVSAARATPQVCAAPRVWRHVGTTCCHRSAGRPVHFSPRRILCPPKSRCVSSLLGDKARMSCLRL